MKTHEEEIRDLMSSITTLCRDRLSISDYRKVSNTAAQAILAAKKADRRASRESKLTEGLPTERPYTQKEVARSEDKKKADCLRILEILETGSSMTPLDANRIGILRLGARIWDLRHDGYSISTTMVKVGRSRIASYRLIR